MASQKELQKMYIAGKEEQIETKKYKAKELNRQIKRLEDLLAAEKKG